MVLPHVPPIIYYSSADPTALIDPAKIKGCAYDTYEGGT